MNRFKTYFVIVAVGGLATLQGCKSSGTSTPPPLQTTSITVLPEGEPKVSQGPATQAAENSLPHPVTAPPANPVVASPPIRTAQSADNASVAHLRGESITIAQLLPILLEGYGLNVLQHFASLEAVKQEARRQDITISPEDIKAEFDINAAKLFPDAEKSDYERSLAQLLKQEHSSRAEFDLLMQSNAYLRKMALRIVKDKITDEILKEAFLQTYGEKAQVRHIELGNMQEVLEVQRLLAAGQPFEEIARQKSHNAHTAGLGGELPPFVRGDENYPQSFRDLAFSLKEGQVSTPLNVNGTFQIIKLIQRIAPKAVKFEDVKESLRENVLDTATSAAMQQLRASIAADAVKELTIDNPIIKEQYDSLIRQREDAKTIDNKVKAEWDRKRAEALGATTQQSTTQPTPVDTSTPAVPILPAPGVAQPPATKSETPGSGVPDLPELIPQ